MGAVEVIEEPARQVAIVRRVVAADGLPAFFDDVFGTVAGAILGAGAQIAGPPFGWYHGRPTDQVDVSAGFPMSGTMDDANDADDVRVVERPGGRAATTVHVGPFDRLEQTYAEVERWMSEQGLAPSDEMWEEYLTDPAADPDPATWQTRIVLLLR